MTPHADRRARLLDLFCGAGGAGMGYYRAGFEVVGVDIKPQPNYPFEFHQADALEYLAEHGYEFDAIHASPPCQLFSIATKEEHRKNHKNLITPVREILTKFDKPHVIENVEGARRVMDNPFVLCGTMFGLGVFRHRCFETNIFILEIEHTKHTGIIGDGNYFSVAGGAGRWKTWGKVMRNVSKGTVAEWKNAMGIDWMTRKELTQAIPPAYTEYIGHYLMQHIEARNDMD